MFLIALLKLFNLRLEFFNLLDCIPLLLLAGLSTLSISADALAFFAVAPLISVVGTLFEEFGDFIGVEISPGDFIPEKQICPE